MNLLECVGVAALVVFITYIVYKAILNIVQSEILDFIMNNVTEVSVYDTSNHERSQYYIAYYDGLRTVRLKRKNDNETSI